MRASGCARCAGNRFSPSTRTHLLSEAVFEAIAGTCGGMHLRFRSWTGRIR
jgi:hypothetical protein